VVSIIGFTSAILAVPLVKDDTLALVLGGVVFGFVTETTNVELILVTLNVVHDSTSCQILSCAETVNVAKNKPDNKSNCFFIMLKFWLMFNS